MFCFKTKRQKTLKDKNREALGETLYGTHKQNECIKNVSLF